LKVLCDYCNYIIDIIIAYNMDEFMELLFEADEEFERAEVARYNWNKLINAVLDEIYNRCEERRCVRLFIIYLTSKNSHYPLSNLSNTIESFL